MGDLLGVHIMREETTRQSCTGRVASLPVACSESCIWVAFAFEWRFLMTKQYGTDGLHVVWRHSERSAREACWSWNDWHLFRTAEVRSLQKIVPTYVFLCTGLFEMLEKPHHLEVRGTNRVPLEVIGHVFQNVSFDSLQYESMSQRTFFVYSFIV